MIRQECKQCPWRRGDGCLDETKCRLNTNSNTHKANSNTPNALKALDALDLISRQAAIDAFMTATSDGDKADWCKWVLSHVPSATLDALDCISRQAAIDALEVKYMSFGIFREQRAASQCIDVIKNLPSAQRTARWIPVSERLPKINGQYLVTKTDHITNEHLIDIAFFVDWYQNNNGFYKADRVIAWKPLPDPYKEEQE